MKRFFFISIAIIFLASCSSIKVTTDYDKEADFSKYKTASFLGWQDDAEKLLNDIDKKRFRDAFRVEMKKRNIEIVEEDGDMALALFLVTDQKTSVNAYTNYYGGGGGYGRYRRGGWGWGSGYSTTTYSESDYIQGTLVVDAYDNASGDLIWQGVGTGTVQEKAEKREKTIPKAVTAVMAKFPITPEK